MKALTVQQPWAWAIIHGGKDVENRTQAWSYRGPLAIHAGARLSERGAVSPLVVRAAMRRAAEEGWVHESRIDELVEDAIAVGGISFTPAYMGAIIGVVDLVDVHVEDLCCDPWGEHGSTTVHLELANPRPLPEPIPCRGRLGLWTPPADVLAQLQAVA